MLNEHYRLVQKIPQRSIVYQPLSQHYHFQLQLYVTLKSRKIFLRPQFVVWLLCKWICHPFVAFSHHVHWRQKTRRTFNFLLLYNSYHHVVVLQLCKWAIGVLSFRRHHFHSSSSRWRKIIISTTIFLLITHFSAMSSSSRDALEFRQLEETREWKE